MQNNNTLDNNYNILEILSKNNISTIYLVRNINDNNQYAAKVKLINPVDIQNELQMITIASGLNNPNIIHLNGHGVGTLAYNGIITNNVNYMILEYCPRGNLFNYIQLGRLTERQAKYIFKKILLGVQALHIAGYCHRNLNLQNILLDQNFNPKINDFSFAMQIQDNTKSIPLNRVLYASPEIFLHRPYNGEKADIFSLGVILFNLVTGAIGFHKADHCDIFYKYIAKGQFKEYWENLSKKINLNLSEEFKNLYFSMVSFKEKDRPNIDQILHNPWFNEIVDLNAQELNQLEMDVRNEFLKRNDQVEEDKKRNYDDNA